MVEQRRQNYPTSRPPYSCGCGGGAAHLPFVLHASSMLVFLAVSPMILSHALSMMSKRFASCGSWLRMSSLQEGSCKQKGLGFRGFQG